MRIKAFIVAMLCLALASTLVAQDPAKPPSAVFVLGLVVDLSAELGFTKQGVREKAEKLLTTVAEESGGRVFFPETKEELVAAAAEIILDLRAQFRIKYQSTHDPSKKGVRKVDVKFVSTDGEKRNMIFPRAYHVGPTTPPGK